MKICLDARTVYSPARRGTGKNLIDLYRRIALARPDWRLVMFHRGLGLDDPYAGLANVENRGIDIKGDRFNLWQQLRLPLAACAAGADLLHSPANTAPRWPLSPLLVTIHDLIPLDPALPSPGAARWGRAVGRAARAGRRIMTPSEFSRRQIIQTFGVSADKVCVNHWAADEGCAKVEDPALLAAVRSRYGLDSGRPYIFAFGAADPRKNTARLMAAWARLPDKRRREAALLVVGIQAAALPAFRRQAEDLGVAGSVILSGFAPEADIPALLSGAAALAYPSLSEGFGLPLLDAFACDAPVLTSDRTSLPEVAGEAALLVNPEDVAALAVALERLLSEAGLRADLARRGRDRLRNFTWAACTERACRIIEDAVGAKS